MTEGYRSVTQETYTSKEAILNDKNEILIDIPANLLGLDSVKAFADEHHLTLKQEFHVTILGGKASKKITEVVSSQNNGEQMRKDIQALAESVNWQFDFKPHFFYLNREYNDPDPLDPQKTIPEIRETIIQLADVPQLAIFQEKLRALLGIEESIEALPHVTIYSNSSREDKKQRGIGIYSSQDLEISNAKEINIVEDSGNG